MSSTPRVLVVSTSYPRFEDDPSGHFVRSEALALVRSGAEVHVVAPCPWAPGNGDVVAHPFGGETLFSWPGASARARANPGTLAVVPPVALRIRRLVARIGRLDRAILHFVVPTAWPLVPALQGVDVEGVAHGADVRLLLGLPTPLRSLIVRHLLERCSRVRFVAAHLLDRLQASLGAPLARELAAKAFVSPLSIDVPSKAELREPPRATPREPYVVWVGRDVPEKRLSTALSAAEISGRRLVVVGAEARDRAGTNITFVGRVPRKDALAWIAHADVLLSTSTSEGAPTAIREARALGVPVVAVAAGDVPRWAEVDSGIALTAADPLSIARALASTR